MFDCGPQFIALFTRKLYHLFKSKVVLFTNLYLQTNEQTEWVNQEYN